MPKFPGEICIVAKAADVSNLADELPCPQQVPAMQKARGMIQAERIYEITAGRIPHRKELLERTQRNTRASGHLARTEFWIGITIFYEVADALEQFVRMKGNTRRIGWSK